jgi:hypothetical protein
MIFGIKARINFMIKKSLLLIGVQLICFSVHYSSEAVPISKIVKTVENTRVEIKPISVVVGGDPNATPTGWKGFKEYTSLAFVKFQIRIFRNGKMLVDDTTGSYSYRGGDLPELVQIKNLDRDRELEVVIHFRNYTGEAKYRMLHKLYYDWNPNNKKYTKSGQCEQEGSISQC